MRKVGREQLHPNNAANKRIRGKEIITNTMPTRKTRVFYSYMHTTYRSALIPLLGKHGENNNFSLATRPYIAQDLYTSNAVTSGVSDHVPS